MHTCTLFTRAYQRRVLTCTCKHAHCSHEHTCTGTCYSGPYGILPTLRLIGAHARAHTNSHKHIDTTHTLHTHHVHVHILTYTNTQTLHTHYTHTTWTCTSACTRTRTSYGRHNGIAISQAHGCTRGVKRVCLGGV
jgi:hypothetical protein